MSLHLKKVAVCKNTIWSHTMKMQHIRLSFNLCLKNDAIIWIILINKFLQWLNNTLGNNTIECKKLATNSYVAVTFRHSCLTVFAWRRLMLPTWNFCCEFLAFYGVITQSVIQSFTIQSLEKIIKVCDRGIFLFIRESPSLLKNN